MRRVAGTAAIVIGAIAFLLGLFCTPYVQGLLPLSFVNGGGEHTYYRAVPATPQTPSYAAPLLMLVGGITIAIGIAVRRKNAV